MIKVSDFKNVLLFLEREGCGGIQVTGSSRVGFITPNGLTGSIEITRGKFVEIIDGETTEHDDFETLRKAWYFGAGLVVEFELEDGSFYSALMADESDTSIEIAMNNGRKEGHTITDDTGFSIYEDGEWIAGGGASK